MTHKILLQTAAGAALASIACMAQAVQDDPAHIKDQAETPTVFVSGRSAQDGRLAARLATGTAGPAHDTPFSVSSVGAELLRDQAGTTLQDALRNVPGAQPDSGFNGAHTQFFSLRGAVADSGTGSNRVLRDGVRLSNYPYVPGFVDSVDVLRGPGAAVGVRSEPGGTVNIVTRQPLMRDASSVFASVGEHAAQELTLDLNRVLSAENGVAARIIATRSRASEWRHVEDRLDGVKLGIANKAGGPVHLRAGLEATNQVYQPDYGIPGAGDRPAAIPRDRQFGEPFGDSTTRNRIADLHGDVDLGRGTRLGADLTHLEAHSTSIKNLLNGSPLPGRPGGTYARVSAWEPDTTRRIDSAALTLTSRQRLGGVTHALFAGLDYYRETLDQPSLAVPASTSAAINIYAPVFGLVTAPAPGAVMARSLTTQNLTARALSLQDQVDLGAWSLIGGLRYTDQDFVYGAAGVRAVREKDWSPKLGVLYRIGDSHTLYTNLARGLAPNQVASSTNQSLPSREADQLELGWKSLWLGGALAGDVAVYQLRQTNMISADASTPLNNFDFTVDGSARSRGLEAALNGKLGDRLDLALIYAYTHAKYLENAVYGGKRVPNVARHALSLWGQYHWNRNWKTGAGIYAQGARFADEANTTTLPGYARLDLTHGWAIKLAGGGALEVQLALRNALDQGYFVSSHVHVSRWITPGQRRNASLSASYRF